MAATFMAMNEVYGAFFDVDQEEMFDSSASEEKRPPRDLFVFDDQLHMIRQSVTGTNRALRALAQGYPARPRSTRNPSIPAGLSDAPGAPGPNGNRARSAAPWSTETSHSWNSSRCCS